MLNSSMKKSSFFKKVDMIDMIEKKNGVINPVLVSFQNGHLKADQAKNMTATLSLDKSGDTHVEIVSSDGQKFKEVNFNRPKTKQYLVIHNKKSHKMKIVEVDSALLINSSLVDSKNDVDSKNSTNRFEDLSKLGKAFGGKRMLSKLQQRAKLNLDSSLINDEMKMAAQDIKTKPDETVSSREAEMESIIQILPPCNRDAREVSNVYALSEILNDEELETLKLEVANIDFEDLENLNGFSEFFKFCCSEAKKSKENLSEKLAAILFIEILIRFLKTSSRQLGTKKANFCPFSSLIHSKVVKEFCTRTGSTITRPFLMRDKALCYIMTTALICCNFQVNLQILATSSATNFNRLTRLVRAVGALPSSKDGIIFSLKVPLPPLPKSSITRTKRK